MAKATYYFEALCSLALFGFGLTPTYASTEAPSGVSAQIAAPVQTAPAPVLPLSPLGLFDAAVQTLRDNVHDPKRRHPKWEALVMSTRRQLESPADEAKARQAIAAVLAPLGPSHASLLSDEDQAYWALTSAFSGRMEGGRLRHIGAWFERAGKRWFIRTVFAGSPAERAGLRRGDEIVSVDGNPLAPVLAFSGQRPGEQSTVVYRRFPWEKPVRVQVETVLESFQETQLHALTLGQTRRQVQGKSVAYVALSAATHPRLRAAFADAVRTAEKAADALVIDLRGSYGGADLTYVEPFFPQPVPQEPTGARANPALYDKPLVALVDGGTRHGKEWLARLLQTSKRATLVGQRTAGALLVGRPFEIAPRHLMLYLTTSTSPTDTAAKLDGQPLIPDVIVEDSLLYSAGDDPQLRQALITAAGLVQ